MAVEIVNLELLDWVEVTNDWPGKVAADEPDVRYKPFAIASAAVPAGQLVQYEPGHVEAEHSHQEGELFFVVDGSFTVGERELTAGTLTYIPGGTRYGAVAGPSGVRFLRLHLEESTSA